MKNIQRLFNQYFFVKLLFVGAGVLLFSYFVYAQNTPVLTERTLYVFPGSISSDTWKNVSSLYRQDYDDDALYQEFNKSGSAYLEKEKEIEEDSSIDVTPQAEEESVDESDTTQIEEIGTEEEEGNSGENAPAVEEVPEDGGHNEEVSEQDHASSDTSVSSENTESITPAASEETEQAEPESIEAEEEAPQAEKEPSSFFARLTEKVSFLFAESESSVSSENTESITPAVEEVPGLYEDGHVDEQHNEEVGEQEHTSDESHDPDTGVPPQESATTTTDEISGIQEEISTTSVVAIQKHFCEGDEKCETYALEFEDFDIPGLGSGEVIQDAQLRLSLAAKPRTHQTLEHEGLLIEYTFDGVWQDAGAIPLDEEVSNAINGGYFLYALPQIANVDLLKAMKVRVTYYGAPEDLENIFIDSAWVQLGVETLDEKTLRARVSPEALTDLEKPVEHELLSQEIDFTENELPTFALKYHEQRNFIIRFFRSIFAQKVATVAHVALVHNDFGDTGVIPDINMTDDGLWTISVPESEREKLKPGKYKLQISVDEGNAEFDDSFEFQWGLLAINTHKSEYINNETAQISLAALSENGNTVCDAHLLVYVLQPDDFIRRIPVTESGKCFGNNVVDTPDYVATYETTVTGTHTLYVERVDDAGNVIAHTEDTFEVVDSAPVSIERSAPTRIYPVSPYDMRITVTAHQDFSGTFIDQVPYDYEISNTDATTSIEGETKKITWPIALKKGESQTFTYSFDSPDISPYLYLMGPASIVLDEGQEFAPSMSASSTEMHDAIIEEVEEVPQGTTETATDTPKIEEEHHDEEDNSTEVVSNGEVSEDASNTPVIEEEVTIPDVITEQHPEEEIIIPEVLPEPDLVPEVEDEEQPLLQSTYVEDLAGETTEEVGSTTVASSSEPEILEKKASSTKKAISYTERRKWQIASDATGSMIVFWTDGASVPAGWTCISCSATGTFYQRFPKGGPTYNTIGGAATSSHTASGTVSASADTGTENRAGTEVTLSSHSHTYTPVVVATSTLPGYRQLRVIQNNSAGMPASLPAGVVLMFDSTVPSGWGRYTQLDNRFPRGENTITTAGTSTHIHDVIGTTSAASGSTVDGRAGGTQNPGAGASHQHIVNASTTPVNHEPPFITVIYGTTTVATTTPLNAITMWTDTPPAGWLNRSAQAGDPFYDVFPKGASLYGTTGGSVSHTHADISTTTSSTTANSVARTGATGSPQGHKHTILIDNFSTDSHIPPFITVVFAKYLGSNPAYTQSAFRWYVNNATSTTPDDPWAAGTNDLGLNEAIDATNTPVRYGDILRLRLQANVQVSTSSAQLFKLQFGSTTVEDCSAISVWTDVGSATSSVEWRGYDNASLTDGATLSSSTLSGTDVLETYEEENPSASTPNAIGIGQEGEWDFVLQQNGAFQGAYYCFRMVKSDGTPFFAYTTYPSATVNVAPDAPTLNSPFDNEGVASTSPLFTFSGVDSESDDITYQIQIDDDSTFSSVNVDKNSTSNNTQFDNLVDPADKDSFTQGDQIQFHLTSALSNNTTYYWRVRGKDSSGSNSYGSWSTIRSFTATTSVTVSTWFQTTQAQFNTDTLYGTVATTSNTVQLITGSTTGTTTSSAINFSDGTTGNAWGSLAFTDTHVLSALRYHIQYYDAENDVWSLIPDTVLSGNAVGFATSSVSLLNVDVGTYPTIRIFTDFYNQGGTPVLQDWTISWGYRVETPTLTALFDNEKTGTTTPTFEFNTTDPQGDALQYEFSWSTTSAFTSSTTRFSGVNAGFLDTSSTTDTSPFGSGDTIQFTIQAADVLKNNETYWWKVRARDPGGANGWSFYSTPRSFTTSVSTTSPSTWFQTTTEQFLTDDLSSIGTISTTSVSVSTSTDDALVAYGEGVATTPKYRTWDGTTWSAQANALDVGAAINWVVTKSSPISNQYALGTMGSDADINVQIYSQGSWAHLQEITTLIPNTNMRGFDLAYETLSGDLMVVACDGDANPTYYLWDGDTWTDEGGIGLTGGNTCGWVKLISDPVSDEIIAVTRDTTGITFEARVWNGSSWGNSATWGSMAAADVNKEGMAASYEESGNQAIVAVANGGAANFTWRSWNGAVWTAASTLGSTIGDDFEWGSLVSDSGTDNMALCYVDTDNDLGYIRWDGSAWVGQAEFEVSNGVDTDRRVDCAYETGGSRDGNIMIAYNDTTRMRYVSYKASAGALSGEGSIATTTNSSSTVQLRRTGDGKILEMHFNNTLDRYNFSYWGPFGTSSATWSTPATIIETDASNGASPFREPFMMAVQNPLTNGVLTSDPIDFDDGDGPYWQQFSWSDTETGGSSITYQVEYYDETTSTWTLVPNSLIPGNSSGTTTGPISLSNMLPVTTYNQLRMIANMNCNLDTCPSLQDWTVTWAGGINISGTAKQFNQSSNVTSGTVAVARNGVLQTGKTGTISGSGTWTIANVNARAGDVITVFIQGAADTNEAVGVATYDGVGDMTGINLFERHLSIGSDDLSTTTNANIGLYDFTNSEDLFANVDAGNDLTVCATTGCEDAELYIKAGNTYQPGPGADIVTRDFENNGTFLPNGNTIRVAGSWDNNATATMATSSLIFTATSTSVTVDDTGASPVTYNNVTFGETSGTAVWNLVTGLDIDGNLATTFGTLARGAQTITVAGNLTNSAGGLWNGGGSTTFDGTVGATWTDAAVTKQDIGKVAIDGTSKTVTLGSNVKTESITIGSDDILDASVSGYAIQVFKRWTNNNTFVARTGTVEFSATTTNNIITQGSSNFYNLTFDGSGTWSFAGASMTIGNDFTISTGTVTLPTGTTTVTGSWNSTGGLFAHNNGGVTFNSAASKTITLAGSNFTNTFYDLAFSGSGSWSFVSANATTSNNLSITQGTVTLPSGIMALGGNLNETGGSFVGNSGILQLTAANAKTLQANGSSFAGLRFTGIGAWSFLDTNITATGDVLLSSGTTTFPTGIFTIGGSFTNVATFTNSTGTALFNSTTTGKTINPGNSSFYNVTFNSTAGGWTISQNATATNAFMLTNASSFTLASTKYLSVGGVFTNSVGGASTTWAGSKLALISNTAYAINTKTNTGDAYDTMILTGSTTLSMWFSSSTSYTLSASSSLYSQDHSNVDGSLYIFGAYQRTSGTEYWNYATDFDGTALSATTSRQVNVRFDTNATATFATGTTLQVLGTTTATTTINKILTGSYALSVISGTINAQYYQFKGMNATGVNLTGSTTITSLQDGDFEVSAASGTAMTISSSTIDKNPTLQISRVNFTTTLSTSTPANWLAGWTYRKSHVITPVTGAGTNYQMKLTLHYGAGTDSGADIYLNSRARSDFGDVRFTRSDGTTLADYWVASSTSGNIADVWVKIPDDISTSSATIYAYYGNGSASYPYLASERAQGDATFLFFDDFSTDLSRWNREIINGIYPDLSSTTTPNYVRIGGGITSGNYGFNSLGSLPTYSAFANNAIGFKARNSSTGIGSVVFRGSATSSNTGYQARFDQRAGEGQSFLKPPYSGWNFLAGCAADASPGTADAWYIYDVTASTSDFKIYRDGTLKKSCSDNQYAGPGQISLQNHYGNHTDYDWVFVRKFQGTEPGQGAWGSEETVTLSSGYNVTAVGTSTSYIWFRSSTGVLSGESYDNDSGNPGSIRWDDSSLTITVSGNVYADEAVTPLGSPTCDNVTTNVKIVVDGSTSYSGSCNSSTGAYSIPGVIVSGDPVLTVFLNTNGGVKGTTITRTPTQNITNLNIYANRVIVRHENSAALTIANMAMYDETQDTDIRFDAATGTTNSLTVRANTELYVFASSTFTPGGTVTLESGGTGTTYDGSLYIDDSAVFTGAGTTTYAIGGRLTVDTNGSFIAASSSVVMTATTTSKTIASSQPITFNNLSFTGVGGGWPITADITVLGTMSVSTGTVSGTGNITITNNSFSGNGTVLLTGGTTLIGKTNTLGGTQPWTFNNLTLGDGSTVGSTTAASTATTTVRGVLTIAAGHMLSGGTSRWDLAGSGTPLVITGTFTADTSSVRYSATTTANVVSTTYYNLDVNAASGTAVFTGTGVGINILNNLSVGGVSPTTFNVDTNDPALGVTGSVLIQSNGTLQSSNSASFTVGGSWINSGGFVHSNGKVIFNSSSLGNTVSPGGSAFYDVDFNNASGGWTIGPSMRSDRNFSILAAQSLTVATSSSGGASWYNTSWSSRKKITIDHTKVSSLGTTTLTNFPVVINTTNSNFKSAANGGNVGKSNGGDILFTSSDGTTKLSHEIETYTATTGEVVAWVKVPVLATSTDTELYMYYGNSGASDQWNVTGTWNDGGSNYLGSVYHMNQGTGVNPTDSSPLGTTGTHVNSPTQTTGQIGGSLLMNGTTQNVNTTYNQNAVTAYTVSAWVKTTDSGIQRAIVQNRGAGTGQSLTLGIGTTGGGHGGAGRVGFELDSNAIDIGVSSVAAINDNNWHYVVGVWSAPSGTAINVNQFTIYIDGVSVATTSGVTGSANSPLNGSGGAKIGRHDSWATNLAGTIDEVRMASTTRSADWIKTEYNNQYSPSTFYTFGAESSPGSIIEVRGTFTNAVGGSNTTWTGSTLYINAGTSTQSINTKSAGGDVYSTLQIGAGTQVRMWNSSAATTTLASTGSLYSQDHAAVDGSLYIYGDYSQTSGTDYWSYATDFDGTALGGSSRAVTVSIAQNATTTISGGTLTIIGTSSASTTITNQGTGTYAFLVNGGTLNASYYTVRNTNASGLILAGTPTITNLSDGDFEVAQNNGSAITVGGTVIDQNPAKTFSRNIFATSTGISPAVNVTATGTSVSSWRFTNYSGAIAGEAFDTDPGGDPGYVVWDDSAGTITVSGNVYSDEGSTPIGAPTCNGASTTVKLRVQGLTTYSGTCNAGTGAYSISGVVYSPGDELIVYLDTNGGAQAANITVDPLSSIGNMHLYQNRVIVRHEDTNPVTIADMALWDSSDDTDIPFTALDAVTDTLTLPANRKLIVWNSKTFAPGGNVTLSGGGAGAAYDGTLELYTNAVFTAANGQSHSIGGSLISGTGAVFNPAQSTVTFTTTGSSRTIDTNNGSFYNLTLNGSGSWVSSDTSLLVGNDLTITAGNFTLPAFGTTTIAGSLLNTGGVFNHATGTLYFTSTSGGKTVRLNTSSMNRATFDGAGGAWSFFGSQGTTTSNFIVSAGTVTFPTGTFMVGGAFNISGGAFVHNSGTIKLTGTSTAGVLYARGSTFNSLTIDSAIGGYSMSDTNVDILGNLRITQGALTLATGTVSIGGSLLNTGGTFAHSSGTVLFNSTDTGETVTPGSSIFNNLSFAGAGGGWTISSHATTTGNFSLTSAAQFTVASGSKLYVMGVFTNTVGGTATNWNGTILDIETGSNYTINTSAAGGDQYQTLIVGSSTALRMWGSAATTTTVGTSSSLYSQNHAGVNGALSIYGNYTRTSGSDYWSYATGFDGTALGGGSRAVTVSFAQNATATYTGASLAIVGSAGATTTITNQGTGTYTLVVNGGTLNASYYAVRNIDASGLQLSGLSTISSLSPGDLELAVANGSLITLASSTLNANAGLTLTGMRFATTTAITGFNVTLSGTTTSAWTFTNHTGNLAGEAYDVDGATACGSLRWTDSTCLITQQAHYRWRNNNGGEGVPDSEWYNASWSKRKRVTLTNADATTYTNAVVKVPVTYDSDMQADFDDLRFTDSSGTTSIPYWIETYTGSSVATAWVKVPSLAASGVTSVYMYYGNGSVSDGSSGTSTFSVFDDFEGGLSAYSGDTSLFTTGGTNVYERTKRLDPTNVLGRTTTGIYNTSSTTSQGQTIRYFQYIDTAGAGANDEACTLFGVNTPGSLKQNYAICLEQFGVDRVSIAKNVYDNDTNGTILASSTMTYVTGWHEIEVKWATNNTIAVTVSRSGSVVATTSVTDSSRTSGGIGFTYWGQHGGWDMYTARPLLATEPTIGYGVEQVSGGATWYSALDTPSSGITVNTTQRLRVSIENSGLVITNQNFRLDYVAKGAAPSCASISYGSYAAVPPQASCGTSPICMQSSTYYTDQASTTDLLSGNGTYTYGQIIEDPSNKTGNLTVQASEYTNVEYALAATSYASDAHYCFRVTNNGSSLDSYSAVAEMGMQYNPVVGVVNLNDGQDIILSPGTTTAVLATTTISDQNGYSDIRFATSSVFRSSVGNMCTTDNNNCYQVSSTSCLLSSCAGNSCVASCTANIQFFADPTDIGTYAGQTWQATIMAQDASGGMGTSTSLGVEMLTLRALDVNSSIGYTSLAVTQDSGSNDATTTVQNIGNDAIDVSLSGTDLTYGGISTIPVNTQKYATSTFNYPTCTFCNLLTGTSTSYEVDLSKPTTTTPVLSDDIYWGISIPYGAAAAAHSGVNTFMAIGD